MVVVILARELLVTSLRGMSEGGGQAFGAAFSGKLKMVFQSVTILVILVYVNYLDRLQRRRRCEHAARVFRDVCIWATIAITVWSGLLYVQRTRRRTTRRTAHVIGAAPQAAPLRADPLIPEL